MIQGLENYTTYWNKGVFGLWINLCLRHLQPWYRLCLPAQLISELQLGERVKPAPQKNYEAVLYFKESHAFFHKKECSPCSSDPVCALFAFDPHS
jgi:hypothetical protein